MLNREFDDVKLAASMALRSKKREVDQRKKAIEVLNRLVHPRTKKKTRLKTFLKDPNAEYAEGWFMCVPKCFNHALDIKLTKRTIKKVEQDLNPAKQVIKKIKQDVWTQGANFAFDVGDILYDNPDGYLDWKQAVKRINLSVQIISAKQVIPPDGENERYSGLVKFKLDRWKNRKIKSINEYVMTQDEFVMFLITGEGVPETKELDSENDESFCEVLGNEEWEPPIHYNLKRITDRAIDELLGICRGIMADGRINIDEVLYICRWIEKNEHIANKWPANVVYKRAKCVLERGQIGAEEEKELFDFLKSFTGETPVDEVVTLSTRLPIKDSLPNIEFRDKHFCFTGKFIFGTRYDCEEEILKRGGYVCERVNENLDYLIIGSVGNTNWIHSTYGRKIERAIELNSQGAHILIVPEEHWIKFLNPQEINKAVDCREALNI